MKASFFRSMPNYKTLCERTAHYNGILAEYHTIASIHLEKSEFTVFCNDFKNSYDYLLPFVDEAIIEHGIWNCVSVMGGERSVLVVMEHYLYPRYLAIAQKSSN